MTHGQRWTSRSIGSRLQHGIFYLLIRAAGRRPAYALLFFVVLWYTLRPMTRARSAPYLARRFPNAGRLQRLWHCFLLNWNFGLTLVDRAASGILGQFSITASPDDELTLKALLGEGRGLILLSGHFGCWQTSSAGLKGIETPVHVLMHRAPDDIDRQHFEHAGTDAPFRIIDPHGYLGGSLEMLDALGKGHILGLMGDRTFGSDRNTVKVPFLGGTVRLPFSAYRLASVTGAPILVFFSTRIGPGQARHQIARIIRVPQGLGRSGDKYIPYAGHFALALEEMVKANPYQFFNFYDMWEN
ncbi:MAG: lipid A biosynthesis acyltransferase [Desulfomicrobium sp.]